jgi:hypothetical protein
LEPLTADEWKQVVLGVMHGQVEPTEEQGGVFSYRVRYDGHWWQVRTPKQVLNVLNMPYVSSAELRRKLSDRYFREFQRLGYPKPVHQRYWQTIAGQRITIWKLSTPHLANIVRMLAAAGRKNPVVNKVLASRGYNEAL